MSFYIVNNEYDMDNAIEECMKLISLDGSQVKLAFNNMGMVNIFMLNLKDQCDFYDVDPEEANFHLEVLVQAKEDEEEAL